MVFPLEKELKESLEKRKSVGHLRTLKKILNSSSADFFSNDYLGLSQNSILKERIEEKNKSSQKNGSTGSRLLSGNSSLAESLETEIAKMFNAEASLLFNSGYNANLGLLQTIPKENDLILLDQLAHASLKNGAKLSKATTHFFKHNNLNHLERKLKEVGKKAKNTYVITESVFSMDGDLAPLNEQAQLCNKYGAYLIVDEAHGAGVLGPEGMGLTSEKSLNGFIFARIVTFGKAFGTHGATVLGSNILKEFLINFCHSFIYTTALPDHSLFSIREALLFQKENPELRHQLHTNCSLFKKALNLKDENKSPIFTYFPNKGEDLKDMSDSLQKSNLDVLPIYSPTVRKDEERLRICIHSFNQKKEIEKLANKILCYQKGTINQRLYL